MLSIRKFKYLSHRLRRSEKGATAVEMALISPLFMVILFGIIELSVALFVNTLVEGGLRDASRIGLTGMNTGAVTREQTIIDIVNSSSLGMVDLKAGDVSSKIYPSFGDIGMPEPYTDVNGDGQYTASNFTFSGVNFPAGEPYDDINANGQWDADMGAAGLGGPGEIVLYTISYNWNFLSGEIVPILKGIIPMHASMVVRNEPF
jgi:Flp pilus assembly pilin Flp